ncbi:uncharacterized protein LOC135823455 isoform X2 [Sycon ciliatum]|uniref:uncharacterized protein LOC135823455 isoform X2 n=1 Tax=Sycon ciliatum TaxID=27933 RepID=UPI0020A96D12
MYSRCHVNISGKDMMFAWEGMRKDEEGLAISIRFSKKSHRKVLKSAIKRECKQSQFVADKDVEFPLPTPTTVTATAFYTAL